MKLIYDVEREVGSVLLVTVICGLALWLIPSLLSPVLSRSAAWFRWFVLGFVGLMLTLFPLGCWWGYSRDVRTLHSGACAILQGKVTNFRYTDTQDGWFEVDGTRFHYLRASIIGFTATDARPIPFHLGLLLQIHHRYGRILRVESEQRAY